MVTVVVVILFTMFTFAVADGRSKTPFSRSTAISPALDPTNDSTSPLFGFEYLMAAWFTSRLVTEVLQMLCASSWEDYFFDFWNILDMVSGAVFFAGFGMRFYCDGNARCVDSEEGVATLWADSVPVGRLFAYYYSISLALLWARLLRIFSVSKNLGPLVILIIHMGSARHPALQVPMALLDVPFSTPPRRPCHGWDSGLSSLPAVDGVVGWRGPGRRDMVYFGVIWGVLLLSFSVLIHGSTGGLMSEACRAHGAEEAGVPIAACWQSWWVVRTFVQALAAEVWIEDMTTDASMLGLTLCFLIMNVLLLNLLIGQSPRALPVLTTPLRAAGTHRGDGPASHHVQLLRAHPERGRAPLPRRRARPPVVWRIPSAISSPDKGSAAPASCTPSSSSTPAAASSLPSPSTSSSSSSTSSTFSARRRTLRAFGAGGSGGSSSTSTCVASAPSRKASCAKSTASGWSQSLRMKRQLCG